MRQRLRASLMLLLIAVMGGLWACGHQPPHLVNGESDFAPVVAPSAPLSAPASTSQPSTVPKPDPDPKYYPPLSSDVTISLTCKEHPEMKYPGGYAVAPGLKHLSIVFSREVDRGQAEATLSQLNGSPMQFAWKNNQEVELKVNLDTDRPCMILVPTDVYEGFVMRAVTDQPLWLVTGPQQTTEIARVTSDTVGMQLSPDQQTLVRTDRLVDYLISPGGDMYYLPGQMSIVDLRTEVAIPLPLRVYTHSSEVLASDAVSPFWSQGAGAFLAVDDGAINVGRSVDVEESAYVIKADGTLTRYSLGLPKDVRVYGSAWSTNRLAVMTKGSDKRIKISDGPPETMGVPISVRLYSDDGALLKEFPDIAWKSEYWFFKPRRDDIYFSSDGRHLLLTGYLPDNDGKWLSRVLSLNLETGEVLVGREGGTRLSPAGYTWDDAKKMMTSPDGMSLTHRPDSISGLRWSPDGTAVAYLDQDNRLWVWDLMTDVAKVWMDIPIRIIGPWGVYGILAIPK